MGILVRSQCNMKEIGWEEELVRNSLRLWQSYKKALISLSIPKLSYCPGMISGKCVLRFRKQQLGPSVANSRRSEWCIFVTGASFWCGSDKGQYSKLHCKWDEANLVSSQLIMRSEVEKPRTGYLCSCPPSSSAIL